MSGSISDSSRSLRTLRGFNVISIKLARPLGHLGDLETPRNTLPVRCGRTCQTALIYLKVDSSNQAHVRRDVVSSGEGDYVGSENLFLIYYLLPISIVRT